MSPEELSLHDRNKCKGDQYKELMFGAEFALSIVTPMMLIYYNNVRLGNYYFNKTESFSSIPYAFIPETNQNRNEY